MEFDRWLAQLDNIEALRPLFENSIYGNSWAQYLLVIVVVALVYTLGRLATWLIEKYVQRLAEKTRNKLDDVILHVVNRSATWILVLMVLYVGVQWLSFPLKLDTFFSKGIFVLLALKLALEIEYVLSFLVEDYLLPIARRQKGLLKTFVPTLLRFNKLVVWSLAFLVIIQNLGYNITSLIAGLGIGGIALALAAQETLGNFFGSLSVLTDQPFKVNDFVRVGDQAGFVKDVGMRSTKILNETGSMVVIPNKTVANSVIENYSQRKHLGVDMTIGLEYGTPRKVIQDFVKEAEKLIKKDKDVDSQTVRVHFTTFGSHSLDIAIYFYVKHTGFIYREYLTVRQRINLKLLELSDKLGAKIAFPTSTIHLAHAEVSSKTRED